jgi:hypothetical protein
MRFERLFPTNVIRPPFTSTVWLVRRAASGVVAVTSMTVTLVTARTWEVGVEAIFRPTQAVIKTVDSAASKRSM